MHVCVSHCYVQLCNPMDFSPTGSSFHGILQVRLLEGVAISLSGGSPQPKDWIWVSCITGRFFTTWATWEASDIIQYLFYFVWLISAECAQGPFICWKWQFLSWLSSFSDGWVILHCVYILCPFLSIHLLMDPWVVSMSWLLQIVLKWTWGWVYKKVSEKAMAPHFSTLAWKIPWTEEPGGLQPMGLLSVGHDWETSLSLFTFMHWRRKWPPTPVFLPGESQGQGSLVGCRLWGHTESDTTEST